MSDQKKTKSLFQVRRKEARAGQRDPYYSPERDIAHVGPYMAKAAMHALEPQFWEPWLKEFLDEQGITLDTILESKAPLLLAQAMSRVIKSENPPAAMKEVGFDTLPPAIQLLFYARLGQVYLAAVWAGVKDVGRPDSDPPIAFTELLDDVQTAFDGFFPQTDDEPETSPTCGEACEDGSCSDSCTTSPANTESG